MNKYTGESNLNEYNFKSFVRLMNANRSTKSEVNEDKIKLAIGTIAREFAKSDYSFIDTLTIDFSMNKLLESGLYGVKCETRLSRLIVKTIKRMGMTRIEHIPTGIRTHLTREFFDFFYGKKNQTRFTECEEPCFQENRVLEKVSKEDDEKPKPKLPIVKLSLLSLSAIMSLISLVVILSWVVGDSFTTLMALKAFLVMVATISALIITGVSIIGAYDLLHEHSKKY